MIFNKSYSAGAVSGVAGIDVLCLATFKHLGRTKTDDRFLATVDCQIELLGYAKYRAPSIS
jgi:hypothetical protein